MPRRSKATLKRDIGIDIRFQSGLVQKLINCIMKRGKKNIARTIIYEALDILIKKNGGDKQKGYQVFERAIMQLKPAVEVKSRRVGGGVYQVPVEVRPSRSLSLAIRWLIESAAKRKDKTMGKRLAVELLEAAEGRGNAYKKKVDVLRMAEANRAFSHYAW